MTNMIKDKQNFLSSKAESLTDHIFNVFKDVEKLLENQKMDIKEIEFSVYELKSKLPFWQEKLNQSEIILATTGTTSSGKSTLVNLLCGEFIMPESVGEMSAGVVEIEHSDHENVLWIKNTKNADWEIGEFKNLSANEIQNKLATVMLKYHALKEKDEANKIECPQIKLKYAIKLAKDLTALGLPENQKFTLKILDLPGLKHLSDKKNAEVINLYCKKALSFLTYNASETDDIKQATLLEQVVKQVKEIGGSPARMLFVLNRFDVFEADMNPEESKKNVREKLTKKIKETLSKELPEYVQAIDQIQLLPLATKPSLLAEMNEFKLLEKFFGYLMDENILNELHRNSDKWSDEEKSLVKNDILKKTNLNQFKEILKNHLNKNLPEIIFPPLIEDFKTALKENLQPLMSKVVSIIASKDKDHDQNKKNLEDLKKEVEKLFKDEKQFLINLKKLNVTDITYQLTKHYNIMRADTDVLSNMNKLIDKSFSFFVDAIQSALVRNDDTKLTNMSHDLPNPYANNLFQAVKNLRNAGYHNDIAARGKENYEEGAQSGKLEAINHALNQLSSTVSVVLPIFLNQNYQRESKRIQERLTIISSNMLKFMHDQYKKLAKKINIPTQEIAQHELKDFSSITFQFQPLKAGFSTHSFSRQEHVGKSYEKVGEERTWYTLWLMKKDVYDYVDKYETRSYKSANIPSFLDIISDSWLPQVGPQIKNLDQEIQQKLFSKIEEVIDINQNSINSEIQVFEKNLEEAKNKLDKEFRDNKAPWEKLSQKLENIQKDMEENFKL